MGATLGGGGFGLGERGDGDLRKMEAAEKPPIHSFQSELYLHNRLPVSHKIRGLGFWHKNKQKTSLPLWLMMLT